MKKINIIIFCIAIMAISVFLILFLKQQSAIYLLIGAFVLGYVIVELIRFRNSNNNLDKSDLIMFLLTLLLAFIPTIISFLNPPFPEQLNRLYFPKDSINFEKEIKISNTDFQKFIFAFDNSGEGLTDIIDKNLQEQYKTYCNAIESFKSTNWSWASDEIKEIKKFSQNKSYGNFLKARLCFDLIKKVNNNGEFIILKIGDPSAKEWKKNFKSFEIDSIKTSITTIIRTNNNERNTNFNTFNEELKNLKTSIKSNEQITLFTYSDFYHDCEGIETDDIIDDIKEKKRELIKDIVHNCFIDNHKRPDKKERTGKYILDSKPDFAYEKFLFIDSINENEKIPIRIKIHKGKKWFYSKKADTTVLYLNFSPCEKSICSHNKINLKDKDKNEFSISNKTAYPEKKQNFGKNENCIKLEYKGKIPPNEETLFEIQHNYIHYFVYFEFIEEWTKDLKWILPIITLFLGLLITLLLRTK